MALLEAMAIGLVPIVSQAANAYNIVENHVNGCVFSTQSSEQLQECMRFLASSPQYLATYRVAARATVAKISRWNVALTAMLPFISRLLTILPDTDLFPLVP